MAFLIAQLTDLHLGAAPGGSAEPNAQRLAAALAAVRDMAPDMLFVTGDLTQHGQAQDYRQLAGMLAGFPCPVHLALGNHDRRDAFRTTFPNVPLADDHVQYVIEHPDLRCIVLDTLHEGREGGDFCDRRAAWLSSRLAETAQPTMILLHHPPVAVGVAAMDPDPGAAWTDRLRNTIAPHRHVVALAAGHLHGASVTGWHGVPVVIAPSIAPALALSLERHAAAPGDNAFATVESQPGFVLHRWEGGQLTSHFACVVRRFAG